MLVLRHHRLFALCNESDGASSADIARKVPFCKHSLATGVIGVKRLVSLSRRLGGAHVVGLWGSEDLGLVALHKFGLRCSGEGMCSYFWDFQRKFNLFLMISNRVVVKLS